MDCQGKIALVTGGSRGIGRAITLKLVEQGATVIVNYLRNDEAAQEVKRLAGSNSVHLFQANVGDSEEVAKLVDEISQRFKRLDLLVHNAALGAFKPVLQLKPNQWDLSLDVNAKALLLLAQRAVPLMRAGSAIIALSSLGSHRYVPQYGAIGISKAALEALIRYLAVELAPKGIRVNGVSGGPIDTDSLKQFPNYQDLCDTLPRRTPGGRLGTPDDLADVVLWLASDQARWIYGQTIIADGGLSLL